MSIPNITYVRPKSLMEAIDQLSSREPGCTPAAQTFSVVSGMMSSRRQTGEPRSTEGITGITQMPDGVLRIGALTTLTEIANSRIIKETYPGLSRAASEVASPQLRNQGTLG